MLTRDKFKLWVARAITALYPCPLVFHHVPKCAGTSVGRALRKAYLLSQGTVTPEESLKAFAACMAPMTPDQLRIHVLGFREQMLLYMLHSDIKCIAAHVPFSNIAFNSFSHKYRFITVLRDPIERFTSHFLWSYKRAGDEYIIREEFGDFIQTSRAGLMGATYVKYFMGKPLGNSRIGMAETEVAIKNLALLDHVGFMNDMSATERALQTITGKHIRLGHENPGRRDSAAYFELLDHKTRRKVRDICAPDLDVWSAAQALRPNQAEAPHLNTSTISRVALD